jgi:hypothetical protein
MRSVNASGLEQLVVVHECFKRMNKYVDQLSRELHHEDKSGIHRPAVPLQHGGQAIRFD